MKKICLGIGLFLVSQISLAQSDPPLQPSRYLTITAPSRPNQVLNIAAYESSGTQGPPLFLIHGNTTSANAFGRLFRSSLGQTRRLVAIDLPGYGRSSDANFYNFGFFAEVVAAAAQQLNASNAVMVGWSLGGDIALQTYGKLPNAKGYFMFGTVPFGGSLPLPLPILTPLESYAGIAVTYVDIPLLLNFQVNQLVNAFFRPGYTDIPSFFYTDGYRTDGGTRAAVAAATLMTDLSFQPEVTLLTSKITVPVGILHAENDAFFRYSYLQSLAPNIPTLWRGQIQFLTGLGHASMWEDPNQISNLLNQFISENNIH